MRFEHHSEPMISVGDFLFRVLTFVTIALLVVGVALVIGILGYHFFVGLAWLDAFLNASMILTGMGPVDPITSIGGKWFASFYAIFSGVVFAITTGIIIAPIIHRVMHRLHLKEDGD